jgi:hypothetical protein
METMGAENELVENGEGGLQYAIGPKEFTRTDGIFVVNAIPHISRA